MTETEHKRNNFNTKKKRKGSIGEQQIRSISGRLRPDNDVFTDEERKKKPQSIQREREEVSVYI